MSKLVTQQHKVSDYVIPVLNIGGAAFTNQPANDGVEVVSDNAGDTGKMTIWGTTHSTGALTYETITLTGTDAVSTTKTDWGTIYGVFLGDVNGKNSTVAIGTITVREASGNATIKALSAGARGAGTQIFDITGKDVTVHNVSGNTWVQTKVYPTTNNAFKLTAGMAKDQKSTQYLYLLGDTTGSTAQIEVWEE